MAGPGNTVIPSLPPIALIIGKCHLISQVHIAWLISEKGNGRDRDGEMARGVWEPVDSDVLGL